MKSRTSSLHGLSYTAVSTDSPTKLSSEEEEDDDENAHAIEIAMGSKVVRKWQIFPGRNHFCCNGRIMMAKQAGIFYLTCGLIFVTSGLFFGFDCPYLSNHVNPVIPVVAAILFIFVVSTLFRTSFSDPGVLPRATPDEAADTERQIEVPNPTNGTAYRPPPRTKEVVIKGQVVKLKYCFTCKIFRPPRASHCSICDNCVDRFDHHCPWVGNCIGRRNYRYFYLFLVFLSIYCIYMFSCVVTHLILRSQEEENFLEALKKSPASIVEGIVCFFSIWSIIGLAGFHTYLTGSNQTTNEDIKGTFSSRRGQDNFNPFSKGSLCANCSAVVCSPIPPSLIDARGIVQPEAPQPTVNGNSVQPTHSLQTEESNAVNVRHESYGTTSTTPSAQQVPSDQAIAGSPEPPSYTAATTNGSVAYAVAGDGSSSPLGSGAVSPGSGSRSPGSRSIQSRSSSGTGTNVAVSTLSSSQVLTSVETTSQQALIGENL